ncbi:aldehyde dehydrogenase (NAD+) [Oceanotoga teriensis]|uniref:Aldehyde dehydrogenase n=1 Tax=Oceanotoga teriensis TaxID=515440 RepID=A0AA45HHZ4_9BACT|nr:aldehyde dehydrogenase [Oceanotoga teriensis]MDO7976376.1 aldehyde dehydrogenase [Oceanotoga teriensis]PWJ89312.1 aldehyde dehydrogenase (NAD+) [Oceanotoga teriensis]
MEIEQIKTDIENMRKFFSSNQTKSIEFRINQLEKLKDIIQKNQEKIMVALKDDLNKSFFESYETEIGITLSELTHTIKNLKKWSKPQKVKTPITAFPAKSYIKKVPYGVTLIMSPWNYPFNLTFAPLIGSMAGGNCSLIKVSEYSPRTSQIIEKLINENFNPNYIKVWQGEIEVNKEILNQKFDYIFFTGSTNVGKIVMKAACENLTPLTLELGGKSPCIVDKNTNIDKTAKRIAWGKYLNAGQTCVAPDYLLAHKDIKEELIEKIVYYIEKFYSQDPKQSPDYPRIISSKHFDMLIPLIENAEIYYGGEKDSQEKYISPTIINNVKWTDKIMENEIFGPILPVIVWEDLDYTINLINKRPRPLALYLFTNDKEVEEKVLNNIIFGGGVINDTIMHLSNPYLPFGGVGASGMGGYHGKYSFETFTHNMSIMKRGFWPDIKIKYPPYSGKLDTLRKLLK